ncbi:MAG: aminotransferase class I/II-fold pyridoxal phosphate-dependent enzyme [Bacteroidales bacterium]|nr:aminotransferase class I/II-fold pyridoxal phosphate-dependent enzyme [Bacteroidales bacterium]MCM1414592.1 aminotransferase class I/II-fold pyridoxal phosphate-dependent enzyme [bacterium]MCM1423859.1 aminotransferase class I/II-fold pyridoxal phosphate-dependent enzyme [bacterium]
MEKKRIYLSSPTMHGEEQKYVQEAFDTNWVAPLGPNVNAFEKEMAAYTGCGYAAALDSGTAAIHLALRLLQVKRGDVVFVSDLTFSASCNPIVYENATPVFIDAEPDTWNMSPQALRRAYEKYPNPKAVICVHLYGTPAKLDEIMEICEAHGTPMIEDAAESLGSTYKGRYTGTFGKYGIYSFNGNKIITTSGGGMFLSAEEEAAKRVTFMATQARDPARHYQHSQIGYNYRMSNVTAGIGRGQLLHLEEHKAKKKAIYAQYQEAFADIPEIKMNPMNPDGDANNWLSCMTIDKSSRITPDMIMDALDEKLNAETRPIWKPMHLQPVFADCDFWPHDSDDKNGVGAAVFERGLCLPSDIKNTDAQMEAIIRTVKELF